MTDSQCMGRLLASATHDMRNVLAVIRESAGLAQDMVQLAAGADKSADPRVIKALKEAQQQILRGAALAECMGTWPRSAIARTRTHPATWRV